jgi:hypothetical protein
MGGGEESPPQKNPKTHQKTSSEEIGEFFFVWVGTYLNFFFAWNCKTPCPTVRLCCDQRPFKAQELSASNELAVHKFGVSDCKHTCLYAPLIALKVALNWQPDSSWFLEHKANW